jgi:hypothetical protein
MNLSAYQLAYFIARELIFIELCSGDEVYTRDTTSSEATQSVPSAFNKGRFIDSTFSRRISGQREGASSLIYEAEPLPRPSRQSSAASLKEKTLELNPSLPFAIQVAQENTAENLISATTPVLEQKTAEEVFIEVMKFKKRGMKVPASLQHEASVFMGLDLPTIPSHDDDSASRASPAPTRPKHSASRASSRAPSPGPSSAVQASAPPAFAPWSASLPPRSHSARLSPGPSAMRRITRSHSALTAATPHAKVSLNTF